MNNVASELDAFSRTALQELLRVIEELKPSDASVAVAAAVATSAHIIAVAIATGADAIVAAIETRAP